MNKEKILNIVKNIASVIVIIAMLVIVFYQNRDRDMFKFGKEESSKIISSSSVEVGEEFSSGDIGKVGDKIAFLTTTSFSLLDEKAKGERVRVAFAEPVLHTEGDYSACYTPETDEVIVFKKLAKVYSVKAENKIFRAKVNKNGYLFTAMEKEGYNCECMVFNRSGEAIFKWDVSKSEFLDGDVNYGNDTMVLSLSSAGDKKLVGEVSIIDITDAKVINKQSFDKQLFYTVDFNSNDSFTALGSHSLTYFNSDGTEKWSYGYDEKKLLKADVSDNDSMILAFSEEGNVFEGNSSKVMVINRLGKVAAEHTYQGMVADISQGEDVIALVVGKKIHLTNGALRLKKTLEADYTIKKAELFEDKKHIFVLNASGGEILK